MTTSENQIIFTDNLSLSYSSGAGQIDVLKGVDLEVMDGEAVVLVGPSGSGKSSILMLLAGLEDISGGNLKLLNQDVSNFTEDEFALFRKENIGIVFQNFHLIPTMTAIENVAIPLELQQKDDALDQAKSWLDKVGLAHRLDHYPAQLSGGEQQRVAIARALSSNAKLILADEPTGNLDEATGREIAELLFQLNKQEGRTLLLITHDLELAQRADRILRLENGKLHALSHAENLEL
ncbi:MAG: ABC transporter ATP-binding protein [Rhizobiales bacterium]|nr:ABC transporter ATP-binding protein [Hyphomicrobiales bacterium]NRB14599.1 ABC transporter ATP-binding protein [Hyphomicrobiales bacterium]